MFRLLTVLRASNKLSVLATRRGMMTAAKQSSRQKRALNEQQLGSGGQESAGTPPPPAAASTPPPLPAASGGGSNTLPLLGVGGLIAAGGAYYYFNVMEHPETAVSSKEEEAASTTSTADAKPESSEAQPTQPSGKSISSESGNRVLSIQVPAKMKNSVAEAAVPPPSHPAGGNRVVNVFDRQKKSVDDTSTTEQAIKELSDSHTQEATEALLESHQSLWTSVDEKFFQDLDSLNNSQLKARVVQLATEMKDNTKWEAVRLKEFLAMKEKETANTYSELLQKQHLDFEALMADRLREKENELARQTQQALLENEAGAQKSLDAALASQRQEYEEEKKAFEELTTEKVQSMAEEEYGRKLEEYKSRVVQELEQKVSTLEALSTQVAQLETALAASQSTQQGSLQAHRLSAAVLALAEKLETNQSAERELQVMKAAGSADGVIATALATVPPAAAKSGVPTLSELQTSFEEKVLRRGRQAALVPEGRVGVGGQLVGMMFASLKYPPNPEDPAPENDVDNAEFVLARARQHVQLGELENAVEQLEKLHSQAAFCVEDWKKDAMNRIAVEKTLKAMMAELALLNKSLMD